MLEYPLSRRSSLALGLNRLQSMTRSCCFSHIYAANCEPLTQTLVYTELAVAIRTHTTKEASEKGRPERQSPPMSYQERHSPLARQITKRTYCEIELKYFPACHELLDETGPFAPYSR